MLVLGIETSCDETAAAVVEDGRIIRSNVVASQVDLHARFGGVVPELASRKHMERIFPVLDEALEQARVSYRELQGVAVTIGPGLMGALTVGVAAAKALAFSRGLPLVGVNHLLGHIYANFLEHGEIPLPALALVVSGAHSDLILMKEHASYQILGRTRDDAAGEAFDKVARAMGLGYPGGPAIDRLARAGDPYAIPLPRPFAEVDSLDFSFSGIKTAVLRVLHRNPSPDPSFLANLAASFQRVVVETLIEKTMRAARRVSPKAILLAGGVAANSLLREQMAEAVEKLGLPFYRPSPSLCTDNAAMIAACGYYQLRRGERAALTLGAYADLPIS
ncbi:MAG: tRNA (adenosine(37)-N6)-threonylcarbamoyltransferase complex transferase subunit TsaD [Armatimonadota bacterium]|nr:tRNA (adenosine(37)-N6)-threonylcarbamoyltransferase complex transferase subunit TsaD [Armatimonadota bacterium]MDR5702160.1 tRNA (adenosine(37)-N6)-threonylcarbamoyltransferase complex transferase subunit TsaD [Armatimonadota bacterium]MDR7433952.1 tRNA (adenosine(37)-N6)-threonylcarbamoyltransferase complex transferase subunit TsaD [Armatimonadota bacterium]